jgi:thymidine phosphorylase
MVHAKIGDPVEKDSPLVTVCFNDAARAEEAVREILNAYSVGAESATPPKLIKAVLR